MCFSPCTFGTCRALPAKISGTEAVALAVLLVLVDLSPGVEPALHQRALGTVVGTGDGWGDDPPAGARLGLVVGRKLELLGELASLGVQRKAEDDALGANNNRGLGFVEHTLDLDYDNQLLSGRKYSVGVQRKRRILARCCTHTHTHTYESV